MTDVTLRAVLFVDTGGALERSLRIVFLVVFIAVAVIAVPPAGGRLANLAELRLRWAPAILGALGIQIVIVAVLPDGVPTLHRVLHVASYALAAAFLVANRRLAGSHLIGLGALCNLIAILANNGVMPASAAALRAAGLPATSRGFRNSTYLAHARIQLLGDIFAIPKGWPFHNVFSIGDICIVLGITITIHTVANSRLALRRHGARRAARLSRGDRSSEETRH